jgi:hypothetical protein
MARVCILPAPDTNGPTEAPKILSLPHPRTSTSTRFLLHPTRGLHELTVIPSTPSQPRSWLLTTANEPAKDGWIGNGQVLSDGALHIATPIDPLFLLLPHLLPPKQTRFLPADDILESLAQCWQPVIRPGTVARRQLEARLRAVSDAVDVGEEKAYRPSQPKVLSALAKKCLDMASGGLPKSLEDEFVTKPLVRPVTGVVVMPEDSEDSEETAPPPQQPTAPPEIVQLLRLRVASQFLAATYLPPTIATLLTEHLAEVHDFAALDEHLQELKKLRAEAAAVRSGDFSLKRGMNDDEAADLRAEKKRKTEEEEKKKKKNISKGVRELSKVNTRGMAKLTSFFKKKE